jgi:hypothetical protein
MFLPAGLCEAGSRAQAPMDGFTACPEGKNIYTVAAHKVMGYRGSPGWIPQRVQGRNQAAFLGPPFCPGQREPEMVSAKGRKP